MTDDRHKPRRPPEPPGGGAETVRQLHGKIQEGYAATRDLRALLGEVRTVMSELGALADRIGKEISEDTLRARIDPLLSDEAIQARFEPILQGVAYRLRNLGDAARDVLVERETALIDHVAKVLGTKKKDDLVKMIADMVVIEVLESVKVLEKAKEDEADAVRTLTAQLPDLADLSAVLEKATERPVPPKARQRPRGHSRNQSRRR